MWLSSDSRKSYQVLDQLRPYHDLLLNKAKIVPHYVLWYNPGAKRLNWSKDDQNCYSGGRYCAPDPDGNGPL